MFKFNEDKRKAFTQVIFDYRYHFEVYIEKIEGCSKDTSCCITTLAGIVIILLLYVDDIIPMVRIPCNIDKRLEIIRYFFSSMGITINIDKTKVMIIKS